MATRFLTAAEARQRWGDADVDRYASNAGVSTAAAVERAIIQAESRAESILLTRYRPSDLPTTPGDATGALKRVVGAFFLYFLAEGMPNPAPHVLRAYDDAMAEARALAAGGQSLVLADEPATDDTRRAVLTTKSCAGTFALTGAMRRF